MSEILEHIRELCAREDREYGTPAEQQWRREVAEKRERKAREVRAAEEKQAQQQAAAINSAAWIDAVDIRVRTHFKDWAWADIDERIREHIEIAQKPLVEATGEVLGQRCAQVCDMFKRADEELRRAFEEKLTEQRERLLALNNLADGMQGLREEFKRALEELCSSFGTQLAELEQRLKAMPGRLPVAKLWQPDSVTYEAQVVSYEGASWQARKDTAQMPGGADWICIARGGHDGLTPNFRGGFNAYKKYRRLDVVEFDGSSFIALRDAPGTPGGDGWQVLSRSGRRGPAGESGSRGGKGERGERGEAAPTIVHWAVDPVHYRAVPMMSDGKPGEPLDLLPLFKSYHAQVST